MSEKIKTKKLAAVRVRGQIDIKKDINDTLEMLNLHNNNWCVVLDNTPTFLGMLKKVKDYITWGEVEDSTVKMLFEKRGEEYKARLSDKKKITKYSKFIEYNKKKYKRYFRLSPPKGGFERKGVKKSFKQGGALGYRGEKINELIKNMV